MSETGIFTDLPAAAYHASEGISKTGLDLVHRSPEHYAAAKAAGTADVDPSPALADGQLIHAMVLEPWRVPELAIVKPDRPARSRRDREWWSMWHARHFGMLIIPQDRWDAAERVAERLREHPVAGELLAAEDPGPAEASAYWIDPSTRVLCKCRPDKVSARHGCNVDIKGTRNAHPEAFARSIESLRYMVSDAMTTDGWQIASGEDRPRPYVFLAVEKEPPFGIGCYRLDRPSRELGEDLYREDLGRYAQCLENGEWPGYSSRRIDLISLPRYAWSRKRRVRVLEL